MWKILDSILMLVLSTVVGWLLCDIRSKYKQAKNENNAIEKGLRSLLKLEIIQIYNGYKDECDVPADINSLMAELYENYHNLGGNGTGTRMFEIINKKPIRKM